MKRQSYLERGFDCFEACTDPRHKDTYGKPYRSRGASHGRNSDEWLYAVTEDGCTLVLEVGAGEATLPIPGSSFRWDGVPRGGRFVGHYPFPITENQARDLAPDSRMCKYTGGICYTSDNVYHRAQEFFEKHGAPKFEQPDSFWEAFEDVARERFAAARELAVKQCPTCAGKGIVPK
jgi:hypothetical protein